jgi:hypothetical protein
VRSLVSGRLSTMERAAGEVACVCPYAIIWPIPRPQPASPTARPVPPHSQHPGTPAPGTPKTHPPQASSPAPPGDPHENQTRPVTANPSPPAKCIPPARCKKNLSAPTHHPATTCVPTCQKITTPPVTNPPHNPIHFRRALRMGSKTPPQSRGHGQGCPFRNGFRSPVIAGKNHWVEQGRDSHAAVYGVGHSHGLVAARRREIARRGGHQSPVWKRVHPAIPRCGGGWCLYRPMEPGSDITW